MLPPDSNFCLCRGCVAYFLSVSAFDAHRTGTGADRRCQPTPRMPELGLELDARGYWRWPVRAYTGPRQEAA